MAASGRGCSQPWRGFCWGACFFLPPRQRGGAATEGGGRGPGLLAALAGLLLGDLFFLPPRQEGEAYSEVVRTGIGIYAMNATLIVILFALLHSRLRDLEDRLKGGSPEGRDSPAPQPDTR